MHYVSVQKLPLLNNLANEKVGTNLTSSTISYFTSSPPHVYIRNPPIVLCFEILSWPSSGNPRRDRRRETRALTNVFDRRRASLLQPDPNDFYVRAFCPARLIRRLPGGSFRVGVAVEAGRRRRVQT